MSATAMPAGKYGLLPDGESQDVPALVASLPAQARRPVPHAEPAGELPPREQPLRAQLFSAEHMERHGRQLAHSHSISPVQNPDRLLAPLSDNPQVLDRACSLLTAAAQANRGLTPAGGWLAATTY